MASGDVAESLIAGLVAQVRARRKYRTVHPGLIARIVRVELRKDGRPKLALQRTCDRLHQVFGAFTTAHPPYQRWLAELRAARANGDAAAWQAACRRVLSSQVSARERLDCLDHFYPNLFAGLPPVRRVLDLGCGVNPLALPWMPLAAPVTYRALDLDEALVGFLNDYFPLAEVDGHAVAGDLGAADALPAGDYDVALLLKTMPCLHVLDAGLDARFLAAIPARHLFLSYPAQSLGGHEKGMRGNYRRAFQELVAGLPWPCTEWQFPHELVFRLDRPPALKAQSTPE